MSASPVTKEDVARAGRQRDRGLELHVRVEKLREEEEERGEVDGAEPDKQQRRKRQLQDEAVAAFSRALSLDATSGDAWYLLST